jgi:hypothetical protein
MCGPLRQVLSWHGGDCGRVHVSGLLVQPLLLTHIEAHPCLSIILDRFRANGTVQRVRLHQHSMPGRFIPCVRPGGRIL